MTGGSLLWLDEARMHLRLALRQMEDSASVRAREHVNQANELLAKAISRGKQQPIVEVLDDTGKDELQI